MSKHDARIIISALVHDGMNASHLTEKARKEIRDALDVVLKLVQRDQQ